MGELAIIFQTNSIESDPDTNVITKKRRQNKFTSISLKETNYKVLNLTTRNNNNGRSSSFIPFIQPTITDNQKNHPSVAGNASSRRAKWDRSGRVEDQSTAAKFVNTDSSSGRHLEARRQRHHRRSHQHHHGTPTSHSRQLTSSTSGAKTTFRKQFR